MKFLVFNLAVAAALVFLFTADRGDVQKMAGQVHDAAADVKAYAKRTLNKGERMLEPVPAAPPPKAKPAPQAAAAKPTSPPPPVPTPVQPPVQTNETPQPVPPAPAPKPVRRFAEAVSAAPAAPLTPNVAKRRQEVLDGIPPAAPAPSGTAAPRLKEGTKLMTATERRNELMSLAEEMELLYARSISR